MYENESELHQYNLVEWQIIKKKKCVKQTTST